MSIRTHKTFVTCSLMLLSSAASAQGYLGIAVGSSQQKVDCAYTLSCETNDSGRKLYGGYKVSSIAALELSYIDFGEADIRTDNAYLRYKAGSVSIGAAAFLPLLPRLTGVARLGISSSKAELSWFSGSRPESISETHTNPYVGVGLGFAITPTLSANASYDRARIKFDNMSITSTLLALGVSQSF